MSDLRSGRWLWGVCSVAGALLAWYLVCACGIVGPDLLASPQEVYSAMMDIAKNGYRDTTLLENISATLGRCLAGFCLAVVTGIPLGLWMGRTALASGFFGYIIQFLRPLPPLSYFVVLILWCGTGNLSKILLLFMAAFPTITSAAMAGVRQVNRQRLQVAQVLGATSWQAFYHVVFPSALSMIFTGVRIALAASFSTVVAAELITASNGIGWMIYSASLTSHDAEGSFRASLP